MEIYPHKNGTYNPYRTLSFCLCRKTSPLFFVYESVNCVLSSLFILFYKNENFQEEHLF